jgi:hypothetical protein
MHLLVVRFPWLLEHKVSMKYIDSACATSRDDTNWTSLCRHILNAAHVMQLVLATQKGTPGSDCQFES